MKKTKKIFSKIVTLVLLVAMLIPFTNIPKVEAEEECNGDWEYHTNYYFFLQAENPHTWATYLANGQNGSFLTNYYTSYLYNFPSDGSTIDFDCEDCDSGFVKITESNSNPDSNFDAGNNRKSWSVKQFYYEFQKDGVSSLLTGDYSTFAFRTDADSKGTKDDRIITYLFHGDWADLGNTTDTSRPVEWDLNNVQLSDRGLAINESIQDLANASILIDKNDAQISDVELGAAALGNGKIDFDMNRVKDSILIYNRYSPTDDKIKYQDNGTIQYYSSAKAPIINLVISRKYEMEDIFTSNISITGGVNSEGQADGSIEVLDTDGKKLIFPSDNESDYIKYESTSGEVNLSQQKSIVIKDNSNNNQSWFLAPTLYQLSYRVCKSSNNAGEVTVTYDGNAEGAENVPSPETKATGSAFTVSTQKPTLAGNTFKIWSTDPNCGNSGNKYEPGAKLSDSLTNNTTLYACWGSTGSEANKDTGVLTYAGLFTGIIALAGGTYYIVKKKNMFKKI